MTNNSNSRFHLFIDFDGTLSPTNVGRELFKTFSADWMTHHPALMAGEIRSAEFYRLCARSFPDTITREEIMEWSAQFEIDPYFKQLYSFCLDNQIPVTIISDGFEEYVRPILERAGFGEIDITTNLFRNGASSLQGEGEVLNDRLIPTFPSASESCRCFGAGCKRNEILRRLLPDQLVVFVGDGSSDLCAAEHSDVVFAKDKLAAYCNQEKIPHFTYNSFFDVNRLFQLKYRASEFRPRHQAVLRRVEAYRNE